MVDRAALGFAQGLMQGAERNRLIGLDDADRERRHAREDAADRRARTDHANNQRLARMRFAALQRGAQEEGAAELVAMLEKGVDPRAAVERYNSYGVSRIRPDSFQFDPKTGAVRYETADGNAFSGSLKQMRQMVDAMQGPGPAGEGFTLSPGETRFGADGQPIASVPATEGGAGNTSLPADARMVEYLVGNGVFADKGEAYAFVRMSQTSPTDAVMSYVSLADKKQQMQGLMPGVPGYKSPEELQKEGLQFVRDIQQQYMQSFKRGPAPGGLDDLGGGPARSGTAAPAGGAPYAEGQELVDRNTGKRYIVKNGQPVPVEGS